VYFEQSFYNNALNIRGGQQAADVEFFDSETDDLFINGTFGWPAIMAGNLPSGGPAPPIAVPGIRVKATLSDRITVFGAVFNGNPARRGDGDPQLRDNHGPAFRVNDPPWVIGQVRWDYNIDVGGRPLAGNFGIFAVLEQTLYRPASVTEKGVSASLPGVTAFARIAYSPPDRNLIDLYVDGGIGVSGLVPGRSRDRSFANRRRRGVWRDDHAQILKKNACRYMQAFSQLTIEVLEVICARRLTPPARSPPA
jgi:porin